MPKNKKFWQFKNLTEKKGELLLYGPISEYSWWGDEVTPKQFAEDLKALGDIDELDVRINSGGGDVFAAHAIHSQLKSHKSHVKVYIDGLAASAATIIAMAGDTVYIPSNAMMMIHNPWTLASGDSSELIKVADILDKVKESIIAVYQAKTQLDKDELSRLMDEETWMTGSEAVEMGFADELLNAVEVAASLQGNRLIVNGLSHDISMFNSRPKLPQQISAGDEPPQKNTNTSVKEERKLDLEQLKNEYPELYQQVFDEGVKAERERIKAIDELALPGSEELIKKAKFETGISAEQVAIEIIKAEKQRGAKFLNERNDDAQPLNEVKGSAGPENDLSEDNDELIVKNMVSAANKKRGVSE